MRTFRLGFGILLLYQIALLARQYAIRGEIWHYFVHSLFGVGIGLAVAAIVSAVKQKPVNPWPWLLGGQLAALAPDVLYGMFSMPHSLWMDVFVGHVTVHSVPQPLIVGGVTLLLGGWAWYLTSRKGMAKRGAILAVCVSITFFATIITVRTGGTA